MSENLEAASARTAPPHKESEAPGVADVAEEGASEPIVGAAVGEGEADETVDDKVCAAIFEAEVAHDVEATVPTDCLSQGSPPGTKALLVGFGAEVSFKLLLNAGKGGAGLALGIAVDRRTSLLS